MDVTRMQVIPTMFILMSALVSAISQKKVRFAEAQEIRLYYPEDYESLPIAHAVKISPISHVSRYVPKLYKKSGTFKYNQDSEKKSLSISCTTIEAIHKILLENNLFFETNSRIEEYSFESYSSFLLARICLPVIEATGGKRYMGTLNINTGSRYCLPRKEDMGDISLLISSDSALILSGFSSHFIYAVETKIEDGVRVLKIEMKTIDEIPGMDEMKNVNLLVGKNTELCLVGCSVCFLKAISEKVEGGVRKLIVLVLEKEYVSYMQGMEGINLLLGRNTFVHLDEYGAYLVAAFRTREEGIQCLKIDLSTDELDCIVEKLGNCDISHVLDRNSKVELIEHAIRFIETAGAVEDGLEELSLVCVMDEYIQPSSWKRGLECLVSERTKKCDECVDLISRL